MFLTRRAMPRRTFLRGAGAAVALPLLDAMVPALSRTALAATPPRRLGFIYIPNGAAMPYWKPKGDGPALELSPSLQPLAPFKNQVVVPTGLSHKQAEALGDGNGDHARAQTVWLSGTHPKWTEGADVRNGVTADQLAAQRLGADTPLMSLELGLEQNYLVGNCDNGYSCVYLNTMSWRNDTTPLPVEVDPRVLFERMFGDGGSAANRRARLREDQSLLDWVTSDIARLQGRLGATDRAKVDEYLDAVREIERRIQVSEKQNGASVLQLPDRPVGIPESYDEYAKLMLDLLALAYQTDTTRVFTLMLGREESLRTYPEIGITEAHHPLSHHGGDPEKLRKAHMLNTYHLTLFAHFLAKLQSTPEGDGTLLDRTLLLYGSGMSDGNQHNHHDLPLVLVGGAAMVKGGRHLPFAAGTPMNNLLLAMLDKVGVRPDRFGDATGTAKLEPLSGV
jgi:hypothetical protein